MHLPYIDRPPPISGIHGDVREPRNIIWLCNAHPETYPVSLAEAGVIDLAVHDG